MTVDVNRFVLATGAPRAFADLELDDMDVSPDNARAFERVRALGDALEAGALAVPGKPSLDLILEGAFGSGKTRLAVWLLRRAYAHRGRRRLRQSAFPRFAHATEAVELRFAQRYGEPDEDELRRAEIRECLARSPLVVLDDVGRVSGYKGEEMYLETIVERRWNDGLSTILTMNARPAVNSRFADFLRYFETLAIEGVSERGPKVVEV